MPNRYKEQSTKETMLNKRLLLRDLYRDEVEADLVKHMPQQAGVLTEDELSNLPLPVQQYFRHCGYLGKKKMINAEVEWTNVFLKMAPNKNWVKIKCYQYNSVTEPTRIVYMSSKVMGILPFEGRDKYQDGHGQMLIRLLKLFTVSDVKGKEMDASALVTVLAETMLVPAYALQPYIQWVSVDTNSAKATLSFQGTTVSGTFYFNDQAEMIRFETDDRYLSEKEGTYKKLKWSVIAVNYFENNGIRIPGELKARWHLDSGLYTYFRGSISNIRFDIKDN